MPKASLSAERRVAARFGFALIMLATAAVLADVSLWQASETARWVDHTRVVIEKLDFFLSGLRNVESAEHDFLLSTSGNSLQAAQAIPQLNVTIAQVRSLTVDNGPQQLRLDRLEPLLASFSAFSRSLQNRALSPSTNARLDHEAQQRIAAVRELGYQMRDEEYRLLKQRSENLWLRTNHTRSVLVFALTAAIGLLGFAIWSLYRETRLRLATGRALDESETRHHIAVEAVGIGSWSWDFTNHHLFWSDSCKQMLGVPPDAPPLYEFFEAALHPDDRKATTEAVRHSVATGEQYDVEYRALWPDGSVHWIRAKGTPQRDDAGKTLRLEGIVIDINQQKLSQLALQKSERRYSALFANKTNAIAHCRIITDPNGAPVDYDILQVNHAYELVTGIQKADIEGKTARQVFPGIENDPFDFIGSYGKIALEGGELDFEVYFEPLRQWLSIYVYRPEPGEFIAIFTDVTPQKMAAEALRASEERLRQLAANLDTRVTERTAELEAANHELEAFAYSVSHDLRAPLRGIDGFARILLEEYATEFSPKPQRYLRMVRNEARRMGQLVDDLLSFSRLSRQALSRLSVDVDTLVRHVWQELEPDRQGRDVQLILGQIAPCTAEPAMLKQVWVNLLTNALKFSRKQEQARIEVGSLPPQNGSKGAIYFVKDNGVGFDMTYAAKLFGVFQRLHRAEEYEGTGVGLAIVQRIIRRHGGDIRAQAKPNQGAEFYFTLEGTLTSSHEYLATHA